MRGFPRTAAGGAHFAALPDCRTQRPVFTWRLNFDFPVRKNRKIEVQSANRRRRGASRSGRGGPPFLAAKKWGKEPRGALPLRTPFVFYVSPSPPLPESGRLAAQGRQTPASDRTTRNLRLRNCSCALGYGSTAACGELGITVLFDYHSAAEL